MKAGVFSDDGKVVFLLNLEFDEMVI